MAAPTQSPENHGGRFYARPSDDREPSAIYPGSTVERPSLTQAEALDEKFAELAQHTERMMIRIQELAQRLGADILPPAPTAANDPRVQPVPRGIFSKLEAHGCKILSDVSQGNALLGLIERVV